MSQHAVEFRELAFLLSNGDQSLGEAVYTSASNPEEYLRNYADELADRGITAPIEDLPWIALADRLRENGDLFELDWKESGEMFVESVSKLLANRENTEPARSRLESLELSFPHDIPDVLKRVNRTLEPFGWAAIMVDIRSDCYPITTVSLDQAVNAQKLGNEIENERIFYYR